MIASARNVRPQPARHAGFLAMLPAIRRHARFCFRHDPTATRDELIQEAVATAFVAFARLVELNKADLAYASVLAKYAVAQVHAGRQTAHTDELPGCLLPSLPAQTWRPSTQPGPAERPLCLERCPGRQHPNSCPRRRQLPD